MSKTALNVSKKPFIFRLSALALAIQFSSIGANAGPEGGVVKGGEGSISSVGNTTTIDQLTDRMAIDWQSYDVASDELVKYLQPSSSSISLNRILSNKGSEIMGQIGANGHVFLINPNGIIFGEGSSINVGGILASGLDINPDDFMNGDFAFSALEDAEGKVINAGLINAATGGSVSLLGKQVENEGLIVANLGRVNLAAGNEAVVTFDSSGLMGVRVSEAVLQDELGMDAAVSNTGEISAESGQILLSASVSEDIFSQAVNINGQAKSVVVHDDGSFTLGAGASVVNNGKLDVSASQSSASAAGDIVIIGENITSTGAALAQGEAGRIELHARDTLLLEGEAEVSVSNAEGKAGELYLLGDKVGLTESARALAKGAEGGGNILIGGDKTGSNPLVRNAEFVYLGERALADASAELNGDGGKVITFASDTARIHGELFALSGTEGGNGGFIETSGLKGFEISSVPNAGVRNVFGLAGLWLIDPVDISIVNGSSGSIVGGAFEPTSNSSIGTDTISTALLTTDVTISTENGSGGSGNITFNDTLQMADGFNRESTLTLEASGDVSLVSGSIYGDRDSSGNDDTLGVNAKLNVVIDAGGDYLQSGGNDIILTGGFVDIAASSFTMLGSASNTSIFSGGGDITLNIDGGAVNIGTTGNSARIRAYDGNEATTGGNITINASTIALGQAGGENSAVYIGTRGSSSSVNLRASNSITLNDNVYAIGGSINITGLVDPNNSSIITDPLDNLYLDVSSSAEAVLETASGSVGLGNSIYIAATSINLQEETLIQARTPATSTGTSGDITIEGTIASVANSSSTQYGLTLYGSEVDLDAINISGFVDTNGGDLIIDATEGITTGSIDTSGGNSSGSGDGTIGRDGGAITLSGTSVSVTGAINTSGSDGNDNNNNGNWEWNGGDAGAVNITSTSSGISVLAINAAGGNGDAQGGDSNDDASGGNAGNITLSAASGSGTISLGGDLSLRGGRLFEDDESASPSETNGTIGTLTLTGSDIVLTDDVTISLNMRDVPSGSGSSDTTSNNFSFTGAINSEASEENNLSIIANQITFGGNLGSTQRLGAIDLDATAEISASTNAIVANSLDALTAGSFTSGSITTAGTGASNGGNVVINADTSVSTAAINTSSGDSGKGDVDIDSDGAITTGAITTAGTEIDGNSIDLLSTAGAISTSDIDASAGVQTLAATNGFSGGSVTLKGTNVTTGSIDAAGSAVNNVNASNGNNGGNGGDITITAESDSNDYSITIAGDISAAAGEGDSTGSPGTTGTLQLNLNDTDTNSTNVGTVYLGTNAANTVTLSSFFNVSLDINGSAGVDTLYGSSGTDVYWAINSTGGESQLGEDAASLLGGSIGGIENFVARDNSNVFVVAGSGNTTYLTGGADSTITGPDAANYWRINSSGTDSVIATASSGVEFITFTGMSELIGGTGADNFSINTISAFIGLINGGGGSSDSLTLTDTTNSRVVELVADNPIAAPASGNIGVVNVGAITNSGNADNQLLVSSGANTWAIKDNDDDGNSAAGLSDGIDDGTVTSDIFDETVKFFDFNAVAGGSGVDTFNITDGTIREIDGGGGTDILNAANAANTWNILLATATSGAHNVELNGIEVSFVEDINGGSDVDSYTFSFDNSSETFSGTIDAGANDFDKVTVTGNASVVLGQKLNGVDNAEVLAGSGGQLTVTTPVLETNAVVWQVFDIDGNNASDVDSDGVDDGTVTQALGVGGSASISFTGFASFVGGVNDDQFSIAADGVLSGNINGGAGNNTLTSNNATGTNTWLLTSQTGGSLTQNGNASTFENIQNLVGSTSVTDQLTGSNSNSSWVVGASSSYRIAGTSEANATVFSNMESVVGGTGEDGFDVRSFSAMAINGGDSGQNDTLTLASSASASANYWAMSAPETGTVNAGLVDGTPKLSFEEIEIIVAPDDRTDKFAMAFFTDPLTTILAGSGTGDRLEYLNDTSTAVSVTLASGGASTTGVQGIETISLQNSVAGSTLTVNHTGAVDWTISSGSEQVSIGGAVTSFSNFTNLEGGSGVDEFDIYSATTLTEIDGGEGSDNFNILTSGLALQIVGGENTPDTNFIDTIYGPSADSYWQINGVEQGILSAGTSAPAPSDSQIGFSEIESVVGQDSTDDQFAISTLSSEIDINAGDLVAGTDNDIARYTGAAANVTVNMADDTNMVVGAEALYAGAGSTLIGPNAVTTWNVTGENDVTVGGYNFYDFNNFTGGTNNDTFEIGANVTGTISGGDGNDTFRINATTVTVNNIDGGADTNTLRAPAGGAKFTLDSGTSFNTGTLTNADGSASYVTAFSDIQNYIGGSGSDELDASAVTADLQVDMDVASGVTPVGITAIEVIRARAGQTNTLYAADNSNTWNITGNNAGDIVGEIQFYNFQNLVAGDAPSNSTSGDTFNIDASVASITGGSGSDIFNIDAAVTGSVSGNGGTDQFYINAQVGADDSTTDIDGGAGDDQFHLGNNNVRLQLDGGGNNDTIYGFDADATWDVDANGTSEVRLAVNAEGNGVDFEDIEVLEGSDENADVFLLAGLGAASGLTIRGGESAALPDSVVDTVNYTKDTSNSLVVDVDASAAFSGVQEVERITGNADHTLQASGGGIWSITGANEGSVDGVLFYGFGNLLGGNASASADEFTIELAGSISGLIDGAGGTGDFISRTTATSGSTLWSFTDNGGTTQTELGNLDTNSVSPAFSGPVAATFENIYEVRGSQGSDTYLFAANTTAGKITDVSGNDSLISNHSSSNSWTISGVNSGTVGFLTNDFSGIEHITGSTNSDDFTVTTGSIASITGAGANDELTAQNGGADNLWLLTVNDGGSVQGVTNFSSIENLTGNNGADRFNVSDGVTISGLIDGSNHPVAGDTLDLSAYSTPVSVSLGNSIAGFTTSDVENLILPGGLANSLQGTDSPSIWDIYGANQVRLNGVEYSNVGSLVGGTDSDTFIFESAGDLTGDINAGAGSGTDSITGAGKTNTWVIDSAGGGSLNSVGFSDIEDIIGGAGQDTFTISADVNSIVGGGEGDIFHVNGAFSGSLDGGIGADIFNIAAIVSTEILGGAGDDRFNVQNDIALTLNGGGDSDTIALEHGASAVWTFDSAGAYEQVAATSTVSFRGVEIALGSSVDDLVNINDTTVSGIDINARGGTNTLRVGHGAATNWTIDAINSINAGAITFSNFGVLDGSDSASGIDTFTINTVFTGTIDGRSGGDTFHVNAAVTGNLHGGEGGDTFNLAAPVQALTGSYHVHGEAGNDIFTLLDNSVLANIDGGADNDRLSGFASASTWNIATLSSESTITLAGAAGKAVSFSNVETLLGRDNVADGFVFDMGGSAVGMTISAGAGDATIDTVDFSNLIFLDGAEQVIDVSSSDITGLVGGVERIINDGDHILRASSGSAEITDWVLFDVDSSGTAQDEGSVDGLQFVGFSDLEGGDGTDNFSFNGAIITGDVSGGDGSDTIRRASDKSTFTAADATTWVINEADQGTFDDLTGSFSDIETINGNGADDTFVFADTVNGSVVDAAATWTGTINGGDALTADRLTSQKYEDSTWDVSGNAEGSTTWLNAFTGIEQLVGADDFADTFNIGTNGVIQTIFGGTEGVAGSETILDTLNAENGTAENIWTVARDAGGSLETVASPSNVTMVFSFDGIEDLVGASGKDTFVVVGSSQIDGTYYGENRGAADATPDPYPLLGEDNNLTDTLDLKQYTDTIKVVVGSGSSSEDNSFSKVGVEVTDTDINNTTQVRELYGTSGTSVWQITGKNTVVVDDEEYENFQSLFGHADAEDNFIFAVGGTLTGSISGGNSASATDTLTAYGHAEGTDWLITGTGAGSLEMNVVADSFDGNPIEFSGIEEIYAGDGPDAFRVDSPTLAATTLDISAGNGSNSFDIVSALVGDITGGTDVDSFTIGAVVTGLISAGGDSDVFVVSSSAGDMFFDAGESSNDNDILTVDYSSAANWDLDAVNGWVVRDAGTDGDVNTIELAGFETLNGTDSVDTADFDDDSFTGTFNGRGGNDEFTLSQDDLNFTLRGQDGSSPDVGNDTVINAHTTGAEWIIAASGSYVQATGTVNLSGIDSITGGSGIDIVTTSVDMVRINTRGGPDQITLGGSVSNGVFGGSGSDTITLNSDTVTATINGGDTSNLDSTDDTDTLISSSSNTNIWVVSSEGAGTLSNAGAVSFSNVESITGGTGIDEFDINGELLGLLNGRGGNDIFDIAAGVAGGIVGGTGDDVFTVEQSTFAITIDGEGSELNGDRFIYAVSTGTLNSWVIGADNQGTVTNGQAVTFLGMEHIEGSSLADNFDIAANITGSISGGAGNNQYSFSNSGISTDVIGGADTDEIVATHSDGGTWINTATVQQVVDASATPGTVTFSSVERFTGGDGADVFTIENATDRVITNGGNDSVSTAVSITNGVQLGDGNDTLQVTTAGLLFAADGGGQLLGDTFVGADADAQWTVNSANGGTYSNDNGVNVITLTSFENLTGGSRNDIYTVSADLDGLIDGGGHEQLLSSSSLPDLDADQFGDVIDARSLTGANIFVREDSSSSNDHYSFTNVELVRVTAENGVGLYDTIQSGDGLHSWTINGSNRGFVENAGNVTFFAGFQNIQGGLGVDQFAIEGNNSNYIDGLIHGGGGAAVDTIDYSLVDDAVTVELGAANSGIEDVESVTGYRIGTVGANHQRILVGLDGAASDLSTWVISDFDGVDSVADGTNDGVFTRAGNSYRFTNFNTLVGRDNNDQFTITGAGVITGGLIGGGGNNVIDASGSTSAIIAQLTNANATGNQVGWDLSEINPTDGIVQISGINTVTANSALANTLLGYLASDNIWDIDAPNSGDINGNVRFNNFANLTGGSAKDTFTFATATTLSGLIDGNGGAEDTVDALALADNQVVLIGNGLVAGVTPTLRIANIESITLDGSGNQLIADATNNTWTSSGIDEGVLSNTVAPRADNTLSYTGFSTLRGNSGNDLFVFTGSDRVTGVLLGGDGSDELDLIGYSSAQPQIEVAVSEGMAPLATADFTVNGFEQVTGSAAATSQLRGSNQENSWIIDGQNEGTLNTDLRFIGFSNLLGGSDDDNYEFSSVGEISGYIDAGDHTDGDVVDLSRLAQVNVSLGDGLNQILNVEQVIGNNFNSTLTASDSPNAWLLNDGENDGVINNAVRFTDFNNLVGGSARDTFTIDGGSVTGSIDAAGGDDIINVSLSSGLNGGVNLLGGAGDNDVLTLTGGGANFQVDYSPDVNGSGLLEYSEPQTTSYLVRYNTTETVNDNVIASQITLNGSSSAENIVLGNNQVNVAAYETLVFENKRNVVVNGSADDVILIDGAVDAPESITLRNASVAANDSSAVLVSQAIVLDSTGAVATEGNPLRMDTRELTISSGSNDIHVYNGRALEIAGLSTSARVNVEAQGSVTSTAALSSQGALDITANNGSIELGNTGNSLSGPLSLMAPGNVVDIANNGATNLAAVSAQALNVSSTGNLSDSGAISVNGVSTFNVIGDIVLDDAANDFNNVNITSAANTKLADVNSVNLANYGGSGSLVIEASGINIAAPVSSSAVNLNGRDSNVNINSTINSTGALEIAGNGLNVAGSLAGGSVTLVDQAAGINLAASVNSTSGNVSITSASGSVVMTNSITGAAGMEVQVVAGGQIDMNSAATVQVVGGTVGLRADGNVDVSNITADNVTLASGGRLTDITSGHTIDSTLLELSAGEGIGGEGAANFLTSTERLLVSNGSGQVGLLNDNTVSVERLRNNGNTTLSVGLGDIIIDNNADNTYQDLADANEAGGVANANYNEGELSLFALTGNIFAVGPLDANQPDIVAKSANLIAGFDVGTIGRPFVFHVRDSLYIQATRNIRPRHMIAPPENYVVEALDIDPSESLNLAAEQLVEVEELEEIDPAIFTAVSNYFFDEVSIRLPNDQLYDDELEEYASK